MEQSFVAPRRPILLYHRFPATLLKPGLTGNPMAKGKHRFFAKWRHTALSVGFLTIILVASAHAQPAEYIFWSNDKIRRANIDGSVPTDFISSSGATGFALDPYSKMIYWIEDGTPGFIKRANMHGEGTETLRNDVARGRDFALDLNNNHMYWLETTCCIRRANLDGTGVTTIVNGFNAGRGIALDVPNNKMYWVEQSAGGKIRRANLDGTGAEVLITGITGIGIALDLTGEHIFWGDWNVPRKIRRANLDGTDAQSWITITGHHGIVIQYVMSTSGGGPPVRYVPFKSQYVVLALFALLGCWYVLRPH